MLPIAMALLLLTQGAATAPPPEPQGTGGPAYRVPPPERRHPISYEIVGGLTVFQARIAGRDAWVLADSGAQRSLIDLGFAADAGIAVDAAVAGKARVGSGMALRRVRDVSLSVDGQFETRLPVVPGTDLSGMSRLLGRKIAMVMGAEFYRNFAIITLSAQRKLQIVRSGQVSLPLKAIALLDAEPRVSVEVEGKPVILAVDTGASSGLVVSEQVWKRLGKDVGGCPVATSGRADGNHVTHRRCVASTVKLGPLTIKDLPVMVGGEATSGDGVVGMAVLGAAGGLVLDVGDRKMWLVPQGSAF